MKKLAALMLSLMMVMCLYGCGGDQPTQSDGDTATGTVNEKDVINVRSEEHTSELQSQN